MPQDPRQHPGYSRMFAAGEMTLGLFVPIEAYRGAVPRLRGQEELARRAEALGFAALWFRDVPLLDPNFGDAGQVYDPFVYLGWMAAQTRDIALATGAVVLPLRHPLHVAKAASSVDVLSNGRMVLGAASGDRMIEFPAFGVDPGQRSDRLVEGVDLIRRTLGEEFPDLRGRFGVLSGGDVLPKPFDRLSGLPVLVVGRGGLPLEVIAEIGDGWVTYPRTPEQQRQNVADWRRTVREICGEVFKPFSQSLYIDLTADADAPPSPIHLGWRLGRRALVALLGQLHGSGVNHVILNLKYGERSAEAVLEELGEHVLPHWPALQRAATVSA